MTAGTDGPTWLGAVLAGGRSRRMGRDKASLELEDGRPMAARSVDALRALRRQPLVVTHVVVVGGDPALARQLEVGFVADPEPPSGPVGGLLAALDAAAAGGHEGMVALPCDLPVLEPQA